MQVLFEFLGKKPGEPVTPFSVGISIGMGTTMGAFLTIVAALKLDLLRMSGGPGTTAWSHIARKLIKCLRLSCTYEPAVNTQEQVKVQAPMMPASYKVQRRQLGAQCRSDHRTICLLSHCVLHLRSRWGGRLPRPTVFGPLFFSSFIDGPLAFDCCWLRIFSHVEARKSNACPAQA